MLKVYQIKKRYFIDVNRYGLFPRFTVSAYRDNNMNKTELNPLILNMLIVIFCE